jgi:hypothetical protein
MYEPIPKFTCIVSHNSISIVFQYDVPYSLIAYLEPIIADLFLGMKLDKQLISHIESVVIVHLNQLVTAGRLYKAPNQWVFVDDTFGLMRRALE